MDRELLGAISDAMYEKDVAETKRLLTKHPEALQWSIAGANWIGDAASRGDLPMMEMLLELGVNINGSNPKTGGPLWNAATEGRVDMMKWLLDHGADPKQYDVIGTAAKNGNLPMAKLLVEHGANIHARWGGDDGKSFNALALADAYGHKEVANYLRSLGAVLPDEPVPTAVAKTQAKAGKEKVSEEPLDLEAEIVAHFTKHVGKPEKLAQRQIVQGAAPVAVHIIKPTKDRPHYVLFTTGMSAQPMTPPAGEKDFRYAELMIWLPADWLMSAEQLKQPENAWPLDWMRKIADYPFANETWLGGHYAIVANDEPPQPLAEGVPFTCLLAAARMSDYAKFTASDGRVIETYLLMPLFTEERNLEKRRDIYALFRALDKLKIEQVIDMNRKNAGVSE